MTNELALFANVSAAFIPMRDKQEYTSLGKSTIIALNICDTSYSNQQNEQLSSITQYHGELDV